MHLFFFLYVMQKQKKKGSCFFFFFSLFVVPVVGDGVLSLSFFFFPFCFHVQRDVKLFFCCSLSHVTRTNT